MAPIKHGYHILKNKFTIHQAEAAVSRAWLYNQNQLLPYNSRININRSNINTIIYLLEKMVRTKELQQLPFSLL